MKLSAYLKSKCDLEKNDLAMDVSELITHIRLRNGLTQAKLAKKLKTKQSAIARLEAARQSPTLRTIEKIADVFNMRVELKFRENKQTKI